MTEREIATSVGEEFALRHKMHFLETSAKAADNVDELFTDIARKLVTEAARSEVVSGVKGGEHLGPSSPVSILPSCCRFS